MQSEVPIGALEGPAIRQIRIADLREAVARGLDDFNAYPTFAIFLALIYPVVGWLLAVFIFGADAKHLLYPLLTGFALLGPLAAIGLYEISRARERGLPVTWRNILGVLRSEAIGSIAALGLLLVGIFVLWLMAANLIYQRTLGDIPAATLGGLIERLGTSRGLALIAIGNAVGFVFALIAFAVSVVSFPMLVDRNVGVVTAVATSVRAVVTNPAPMLAWGLLVAVTLAVASAPLLIGLAVAIPVLGHSTWHLYRKVVES